LTLVCSTQVSDHAPGRAGVLHQLEEMSFVTLDGPRPYGEYLRELAQAHILKKQKVLTIVPLYGRVYVYEGTDCRAFFFSLRELAQHRFCLAPPGNGFDTHRAWESLYVSTLVYICIYICMYVYVCV
jgi:hypothetical protein